MMRESENPDFGALLPDMLSNGQIGTLKDFIKTKDGKIEILVVELNEPKAGKEHRINNPKPKAPKCYLH